MKTVIVDSREQKWGHVRDGFDRLGVPWVRSKLWCGDYTWANDQHLVIDRKQGLQEVYGNLIQAHERFRAEAARAQEADVQLVVLVEEPDIATLADVPSWVNPRERDYRYIQAAQLRGKMLGVKLPKKPPVSADRLWAIMQSMADKYGICWRFCAPEQTAQVILDLLGGAPGG